MHADLIKLKRRHAMALLAAMLMGVAVVTAGTAEAANAANRSVALSAGQWQLADEMTQTALFAALGINTVRGVRAIEEKQERFALTLRALRDGNSGLGLDPAPSPEVLQQLDRTDTLWLRYETAMAAVVHDLRWKPLVDEAHIEALMDIHERLIDAIDDTTEAFRQSRQRLTTAQR